MDEKTRPWQAQRGARDIGIHLNNAKSDTAESRIQKIRVPLEQK